MSAYVPTVWRPRADPLGETQFTSARMNKIEAALADLYAVYYAEDLVEASVAGVVAPVYSGPGTPQVAFTVPVGGRFVDLAAECEMKHSANNTSGGGFVLAFSKDGGANFYDGVVPNTGYDSYNIYYDTGGKPLLIGSGGWWLDMTHRPRRLGAGRVFDGDGFLIQDKGVPGTRVWMSAGDWIIRMRYALRQGDGGTLYFKNRRLRAQVLPN